MAVDVTMRIRAEDQASGVLSKVGGVFSNILQGAASFIAANVIQRGAQEIFSFASSSITLAADLNETLNKTNVLFKDAGQSLIDWSRDSVEALGLSQGAALEAASGFGIFFQAAGLAGEELADLTKDALIRATDIGSIANATTEEVAMAMQSFLRGEVEPMRRFGVVADAATLKQKAFEMGLIKTTKDALEPQARVLAAHAVLMEQTAYAQGDWQNTNDEFTGSMKKWQAGLETAKESLGTAFLPLLTQGLGFMNDVGIPVILNMVEGFKEWFKVIGESDIGAILTRIMDAFRGGGGLDIGSMFEPIRSFFDFLVNWWTLNGAPIMENLRSMGESTAETFGNIVADIRPLIDDILAKIAAWMLENGPLIQETLSAIATIWTESIMPAVQIAWDVIQPILRGLVDLILGVVKLAMNLFVSDWDTSWATVKEIFSNVGEALIQAVTALMDGILQLFGTNLDNVIDIMANWIVEAILWGQNLVDGIKQGISNAWDGLKNWFTGLWNDLVGGVQDFLGIQSPSKLFAEIGENMMAGLGTGIGDGATIPVNAITNATSGIVNTAAGIGAGGVGGVGAGGATIIVNIQSPVTFMDENNAVENLRKYVAQAYRQLRSEGTV